MAYLRPGDTVSCKIRDGFVVTSETQIYDRVVDFEVIALDKEGFLVKVPYYLPLKTSFEVTDRKSRDYEIPTNFIGAEAQFITSEHVHIVVSRRDGEKCDRCKYFFPMAERSAEGIFLCYSCRTNKWR